MKKKPFIFYCDDKIKWTEEFKRRHSGEFDIETVTNGKDFEPKLRELIKQKSSPDIILIDLFHPKFDAQHNNEAEQEVLVRTGDDAIKQLEQTIKEVKVPIYDAWDTYGLDMLEQARKICPDTPIAIYTQQGLSIIDDDDLIRVSKLEGEWLLKGRNDFYEAKRLRNMLEYTNYSKITRKSLWALSVITLILTFTIYSWVESKIIVDFVLPLGVSLSIALMPNVIANLERRTRKK